MPAPSVVSLRPDRQHILRSLALAARQTEERLDLYLDPLGVTASDAWCLLLLLEAREARTTALARALGITSSTMTEIADRIERRGWLERQRDPRDRRAVTLRLSSAGHRLAVEASRKLAAFEREIAGKTSDAERNAFSRVVAAALAVLSA